MSELPVGVKRTRQRESVLAVLSKSDKPLGAAEIYAEILKDGDAAWLSTVYRVLELLVKKGAVTKITPSGGETALYELAGEHRHYAVCIGCRKIVYVDCDCALGGYIPRLADKEFRVTGHNLEIFGYCGDCEQL